VAKGMVADIGIQPRQSQQPELPHPPDHPIEAGLGVRIDRRSYREQSV